MTILQSGVIASTGGGYQIERSLRFNSADSAYLNRTFSTPTAGTKWTWSGWVKRSALYATKNYQTIFGTQGAGAQGAIGFGQNGSDEISFKYSGFFRRFSTGLFRDVSAWYHIVVVIDTTQATEANRALLYVNGQTFPWTTSTSITQNDTTQINQNVVHNLGSNSGAGANEYYSGYLAEINFIDGQALTPSSFGETDSATGVWKPKAYSGTYGTNGFYLKFADNSGTTSTTLGKDSSGNGNNWTPNNFSVTAGAGNDSLVDSPTSYGGDTGAGGEVRGNYATLNPVKYVTNSITYSNGNLQYKPGSSYSTTTYVEGTIGVLGGSTGKYYWEISSDQAGNLWTAGVALQNNTIGSSNIGTTGSVMIYNTSKYVNGTETAGYSTQIAANGVLGIALDAATGKVWFRNSTGWFGSGDPAAGTNETGIITGFSGGTLVPVTQANSASTVTANFGQRSFSFTAPSGFKALCTQNLPPVTIGATSTTQANDYFNAVLYTGNSTARSITGVGFQPDFTWIKMRSGVSNHALFDSVRGATQWLASNLTQAETTDSVSLTSFNSDGFSLGTGANLVAVNNNTSTFVAWNWNAGGSNQTISVGQYATSPANVPSIASTVRANTTSGFSIVTASASGTSPVTVGHGCLVNGVATAPSLIIGKVRDVASTNWYVYSSTISAQDYLVLNSNAGKATSSNIWDIAPTSTVFTVGNPQNGWAGGNSGTKTYVFYCFAPVAGYSAFGTYTGNNSTDGPFIYLGFRPKFWMVKRTDSTGDWYIYDSSRSPYNAGIETLAPSQNFGESSFGSLNYFDLLSNGLKIRQNSTNGYANVLNANYIYAAFAESPFKYSLAR